MRFNLNTTFVHVEPDGKIAIKNADGNLNTTFVHVEPLVKVETEAYKAFKYNICTCRAKMNVFLLLELSYLNTTFVHVEHSRPAIGCFSKRFKYNICTCRAGCPHLHISIFIPFKYNICTCRAHS